MELWNITDIHWDGTFSCWKYPSPPNQSLTMGNSGNTGIPIQIWDISQSRVKFDFISTLRHTYSECPATDCQPVRIFPGLSQMYAGMVSSPLRPWQGQSGYREWMNGWVDGWIQEFKLHRRNSFRTIWPEIHGTWPCFFSLDVANMLLISLALILTEWAFSFLLPVKEMYVS